MTLPSNALAYKICSLEELQKFTVARGLMREAPNSHHYCVTAIQRADQESVFPFLALYGELRNRVYEELFMIDENNKCHPQILAASKKTHDEASAMIYAINRPTIRFVGNEILFLGLKLATHEAMDGTSLRSWPSSFLRFERVRILLDEETLCHLLEQESWRAAWEPPLSIVRWSAGLYSVVSFLQKSTSLRHVLIEGAPSAKSAHRDMRQDTQSIIESHTYPLSRLCATVTAMVEFKNCDHWPSLETKIRSTAITHKRLFEKNFRIGIECLAAERLYCQVNAEASEENVLLKAADDWLEANRYSSWPWIYDQINYLDSNPEEGMKEILTKLGPIFDQFYDLSAVRRASRWKDERTQAYVQAHELRLSLDLGVDRESE